RGHRQARVLGSSHSRADCDVRCDDGESKEEGKPAMKIDIFNHIFPKRFFEKYIDAGQGGKDIGKRVSNIQTIVDVDSRMRILDEFGDYVQVLTLPLPPLEILAGPEKSPELAREGNDGLAELVKKHDRFLGFAASLPMNNPAAAEKEMTRTLDELGA